VLDVGAARRLWPWPVPALSAEVAGTWLLAFAAGFAWGLRERDWRRLAVAYPAYLAVLALAAVAALREGGFRSDAARAVTLAALLASAAAFVLAERREARAR
jgi:hypothetical protein